MPSQIIHPLPSAPGEELDTGTGGFPVDGKRTAYDVGSTVGDAVTATPWSAGQISVDSSQRDLSRGTKRTLASYLSKTSLGQTPSSPSAVPNKYPIDQNPSADPVTLSLNDENGYPTSPSGTSNESKFVSDGTLSSRSEAAANLNIIRGRQAPNGKASIDGHTLLKNATMLQSDTVINPSSLDGKLPSLHTTAIDDASPIKNYYGNPAVSNSVIFNRFNPSGNGYEQSTSLKTNQFAVKYEKGTSTIDRNMSFGKLAQVGNALSARAGAEFLSDTDPTGQMSAGAAILPGAAQLGLSRIERDILTARSVLDDMVSGGDSSFVKDLIGLNEDKGGKNISENLLIDPAGQSWGTLNNVLDEYSGLSAVGMQLLSVALIGALSLSISTLGFLLTISGTDTSTITKLDPNIVGRRHYGAYEWDSSGGSYSSVTGIIDQIRSGKFNFWRLIGVKSTRNPLDKCLAVGSLAFFGIDATDATIANAPLKAISKADTAVIQSPGYYAVMARSVNRSFLQISDVFMSLVKAFSSLNIVAGIKQLLSLVDVLRNSKFMKAVGVFSTLGDQCITAGALDKNSDASSVGVGARFLSNIDIADNRAAGKGRLNRDQDPHGTTLAWASFTARDMLIMPSGLRAIAADSILGVPNFNKRGVYPTLPAEKTTYVTPAKSGTESRISPEVREEIEGYLEAEYVPFYIHDIRTNEILSFHAFLASLTDDYTASYDTSEGMGRVDPIKIYKSTHRKLGFSFYIVSTNKDDFDAMWLKINKLTTMVYPQFTEGRSLKGKSDSSIYAPFSQSIAASPLVRVRIGDLIKSNYSKFNLARLFGYTYEGSKFPDAPQPVADSPTEEQSAAVNVAAMNRLGPVLSAGNTFRTADPLAFQILDNPVTTTESTLILPAGLVLEWQEATVPKPYPAGMHRFKVVLDSTSPGSPATAVLKTNYGGEPSRNIIGKEYAFWPTQLQPVGATRDKWNKLNNATDSTAAPTDAVVAAAAESIKSFMIDDPSSASGNVIAKSFRSSGGKGLAGFIESMSFDWYDRVTWTTDEGAGRKAPKMCKVTISFSPIHDITPGLDHEGFNRAPIYPVGPMSPQ